MYGASGQLSVTMPACCSSAMQVRRISYLHARQQHDAGISGGRVGMLHGRGLDRWQGSEHARSELCFVRFL